MSDARSARQKELEEKRKKLQQYRQTKDEKPTKGTSQDTKTDFSTINNIDDVLNNVNKLIPQSETPATPQPQTTQPSTSTETTPTASATSSAAPTPQPARRKFNLAIQNNVVDIDIPPKTVETYSKATQTTETSFDDHSVGVGTGIDSIHAESSLVQSVSQEPQQREITATPQDEQPKELSAAEKEKIVQSQDFAAFITSSSRVIERALYSQTKYNIFVDYAGVDAADASKGRGRDVTLDLKLFDERWSKHRSVTDIAWSPKHNDLIAASYSANEEGTNDPDGVVLVWSLENALQRPEYRFNCQSPVTKVLFNKFSPTSIIGGTYSGQIVIWDLRAKSTPVQQTPLSSIGHTHPVYTMSIVGSKNANSLVSISTDGKLCVWSLENLMQPQEVLELNNKVAQNKPATATAPVAVTALQFPEGEVNQFYVGSEEGAIYQAYRIGSKTGINERYDGHKGPITNIDFHPPTGAIDFSYLFLSSSTDWSSKIWNAKNNARPIYSFEDADDYIYDVKWCPTHPALFTTADGNGALAFWNLNEETEVPILKTTIPSNKAISRMLWSQDGKKILVGDSVGYVYLYDSAEMSVPAADEWQKLEQTLQKLNEQQVEDLEAQASQALNTAI